MNPIDKDTKEPISLWDYVDRNKTSFMFSYGPLGLVEPIPGYAEYVADQLRSSLQSIAYNNIL